MLNIIIRQQRMYQGNSFKWEICSASETGPETKKYKPLKSEQVNKKKHLHMDVQMDFHLIFLIFFI